MNEGKNKYTINKGNKCVRCGTKTASTVYGNLSCPDCKKQILLAVALLSSADMDGYKDLTKQWYQPVRLQEESDIEMEVNGGSMAFNTLN